jgi:hypothetical protein
VLALTQTKLVIEIKYPENAAATTTMTITIPYI